MTTIKSGDGFWVNAKAIFSATLPAPAAPVNTEALNGITATMTSFQNLFANGLPTTTDLAPLIDDSFLSGGANKTMFLEVMLQPGNGPAPGSTFNNITLVNPTDSGAVPNDATHQWFTFGVTNNSGPDSAWLAIKNASGAWLAAGDQRAFNFYVNAQAVKHTGTNASAGYNNQINAGFEHLPGDVTQVVLTGAGVIPATGITIYSASVGRFWPQPCNAYGINTNCIDPAAASASAQYTIRTYTASSATTPVHTYTNRLPLAPVAPSLLSGLSYPSISNVTGTWAAGSTVSATWSAAANTFGDWIDIGAWNQSTQLFNNVGVDISGSTGATTNFTVPNYSGTYTGRNVWLSVRDANGNRLALDYGL